VKVRVKDGNPFLAPDHADYLIGSLMLMKAVGATEFEFVEPFLAQIGNAASVGQDVDVCATNFMLSVVKGIQPKDQLEAMLAAQMAAVHVSTMTFARRLANATTDPARENAERTLNKLARTFTTQLEALKRYRSTGEQKMTVEHQHVTVNEGGQAIVGNVNTGGGSARKNGDQPHGPSIAHAPGKTLPSHIEAIGEEVLRSGR
jgi:hypothetical protein